MNCMFCGNPLTKRQITMIKTKKREIYFCSKECSYQSPLRGNKISNSSKGKELSKETKYKISKKLSEIMIGNTSGSGNRGNYLSEEHKQKISKSLIDHEVNEKTREKISKSNRLTTIRILEKRLKNGEQLVPNWNPKACDYFDEFDLNNNTQGQHARNGGEFHIKELGYWVDYINHDKKLIMEYDEDYHFTDIQREKDMRRQKEIQELYHNYEFVRIQGEV